MVAEFLDALPGDSHWAFQDWRLDQPDGFYLTQKSREHYRLHHVGCHHIGGPFWDGVAHGTVSSVTANQKICSPEPTELFAWLANGSFSHSICRHCVVTSNPHHLRASDSAKQRMAGWLADLKDWKKDHPDEMWHPNTKVTPSTANDAWNFQEELTDDLPLVEGARLVVQVNAFERNPLARQMCIAHYGTNCSVCGFNFMDTYGSSAANYIHVHHLVPLACIGEQYIIDPIKDLRPVCPNCHAAIHLRQPPYGIEELTCMLKGAANA